MIRTRRTLILLLGLLAGCVGLGVFALRALTREERLGRLERAEAHRLRLREAARRIEVSVDRVAASRGDSSGSAREQARALQRRLPRAPWIWHAVALSPSGRLTWPHLHWAATDDARAIAASRRLSCNDFRRETSRWHVGHVARLASARNLLARHPRCDLFDWVRLPLLIEAVGSPQSGATVWSFAHPQTRGVWVARGPRYALVLRAHPEGGGWIGFAVRVGADLTRAFPSLAGVSIGSGSASEASVPFAGLLAGFSLRGTAHPARTSTSWLPVLAVCLCLGLAVLAAGLIVRTLRRELQLAEGRAQLFSLVAHELKTPVAAQLALLETLLSRSLDADERVQYLVALRDETGRLQRMTANLLELHRPEAADPAPARVDLTGLCHRLVEEFEPIAVRAGVEVHCDERSQALVRADARTLELAVGNLLDNALKYTPRQGWVRLDLELAADRADLVVRDSGPGVADGLGDRVFEPFVRGDRRDVPGSGLGLYLARRIAERSGGSLSIEPPGEEPGGFRLSLPRVEA